MEENKYLNYQGMVSTVTTGIAQLDGVCRHISMDAQADELKDAGNRLKNHIFSVGIMGEFRRGKSTVINALLGQEIVPSDIVPTSATLNYVRWDTQKRAEIKFKDGSVKEISVDELSKYVTKITKESEEISATVEDATVFYPCPFCQNGVQIVDTPGLNDDERMTSISENVIPTLDAIIMVLVPDSPFSQSEAEFVRTKLMASDLGKLIFVVNKMDIVRPRDRERLLLSIKEKIETSVLEKMALIYGEDSDEYKNAKEKIGDIKILPISAMQALDGKLDNDLDLLEQSGYLEFEKLLSKMLTEERGVIQLLPPVNKIMSVSKEALETLKTRKEALNIDAEEFAQIQQEAIETINDTRAKKKDEISRLKVKGKNLYAELLPDIDGIYSNIEDSLNEYIDNYQINESDVANDPAIQALSEKIANEIDKKMGGILSIHTEQIIYKIRQQLGNDADELKDFNIQLEKSMGNIRKNISAQASDGSMIKDIAIDAGILFGAANMGVLIPGVGGIIAGFKEHGLKGGIAGGLSGAAISVASLLLAGSVGLVGLPACLIAGAAATFGGKSITNLIFGKKDKINKKINEVKQGLRVAAKNIVDEMRKSSMLNDWLKKTCEEAYDMLAVDIDKEWENSLRTMEDTLTQIKIDIEMNTTNKEKCEKDMEEYENEIKQVLSNVKSVQEKLSSALA